MIAPTIHLQILLPLVHGRSAKELIYQQNIPNTCQTYIQTYIQIHPWRTKYQAAVGPARPEPGPRPRNFVFVLVCIYVHIMNVFGYIFGYMFMICLVYVWYLFGIFCNLKGLEVWQGVKRCITQLHRLVDVPPILSPINSNQPFWPRSGRSKWVAYSICIAIETCYRVACDLQQCITYLGNNNIMLMEF